MPLEIVTVPCLSDNYAFLVHDDAMGHTALVDAPEAAPIQAALDARGWSLDMILITHHHPDHIDGVAALRGRATVVGARDDAERLPPLDLQVAEGDVFEFAGHAVDVFDVSGHTIGHIAFYMADAQAAFTADSLMTMGCGRLFEGTPEQMWQSLSKLAALPPETILCTGHEYTAANTEFALTIEPQNAALQARAKTVSAARAAGRPTVPSTLSEELETNPFLRAHLQQVKDGLNMSDATDVATFAEIRGRKDRF